MVRAAGLLLPAAGGFGVLAFVLWLASPVAAAPPPSGNWSVTGAEAYLDQTIIVTHHEIGIKYLDIIKQLDAVESNPSVKLACEKYLKAVRDIEAGREPDIVKPAALEAKEAARKQGEAAGRKS